MRADEHPDIGDASLPEGAGPGAQGRAHHHQRDGGVEPGPLLRPGKIAKFSLV